MLSLVLKALRSEAREADTRAAGKQAAGAALVADGLIGLENPLDGKDRRPGIGKAFTGMIVGVVFIVVGTLVGSIGSADDGDVVVSGVVVDVRTRSGSNGPTYSPVVEYTDPATGTTYTTSSSVSTGSRPAIGSSAKVAYPPHDPAAGKVLNNATRWARWAFVGIGGFVLLSSGWTFVVRLLSIGGGLKLLMDGRRERREAGDDRGVVEVLAASAEDVIEDVRQARQAQAPEPAPASPTPQLPPAGWYPDPTDDAVLRWFDGTRWTDFTQARPPANA